jgi:enamine deaminase RidA (YjgF/YER057c/UK114 family)
MSSKDIVVDHWPKPRGYSNGRLCEGRALHIAGQIGWTPEGEFVAKDLVGQFSQALGNVLTVLRAAGGTVEDIAEMTCYVTDIAAYRAAQKELGAVWKERMGRHYPAMALVGVASLVEVEALVEIQAVAYLEQP